MKEEFKNVNYENCIGTVFAENDRYIFACDENSVNCDCKSFEILFNEIDKEDMRKQFNSVNNMQTITITTKDKQSKFELHFGFSDEYSRFINNIRKIIFM